LALAQVWVQSGLLCIRPNICPFSTLSQGESAPDADEDIFRISTAPTTTKEGLSQPFLASAAEKVTLLRPVLKENVETHLKTTRLSVPGNTYATFVEDVISPNLNTSTQPTLMWISSSATTAHANMSQGPAMKLKHAKMSSHSGPLKNEAEWPPN
jgi:hypothetical protein